MRASCLQPRLGKLLLRACRKYGARSRTLLLRLPFCAVCLTTHQRQIGLFRWQVAPGRICPIWRTISDAAKSSVACATTSCSCSLASLQ